MKIKFILKEEKKKSAGIGIFIPVPEKYHPQFPSLEEEDDSVPHITVLYIGKTFSDKIEPIVKKTVKNFFNEPLKATIGQVEYFDNRNDPDRGTLVAHCKIDFNQDVGSLRNELNDNLSEKQVKIEDGFLSKPYSPHITLAYFPKTGEWDDSKEPPLYIGPVPKNITFDVEYIELWNGKEKTKFKLDLDDQ